MSNAILLGIGLIDNTAKDLARISKNLRANGRNLASIGSELTMGITLPVVAAGGALLKFAGDLDGMKKALAANMGGLNQANAEFEKLKELAKAPGIGLEEAIKGSYRLQGLGESADEARRQMANFAKVVSLSGGGEAQFGGLLQQFTQMKGVGKILGGDIRFMIENAPVLGKVLNDAFGTANPEKLRDMGITVDQLIEGMMTQMDKLQGIGGSVKNTLENLWTSIRVGGGEIGLAILSATGFGDTLNDLSDNIDKTATSVAKWIRENEGIVQGIGKLLVLMAVTGPIARFIGNISMLSSFVLAAIGKLALMTKGIIEMTAAAYGVKGVTALFAGFGIAIVAAHTELSKIANKDLWDEMQKNANEGIDNTLLRVQALIEGLKQLIFTLNFSGAFENFDKAINGVTPMGAFNNLSRKSLYKGRGEMLSDKYGSKATTPKVPGDPDPTKSDGPFQYDKEDYLNQFSTPDDAPSLEKLMKGFSVADYSKQMPLLGIDRSALDSIVTAKDVMAEYKDELAKVNMEQKMGLAPLDAMKMKVDAAADSYRSMVDLYGQTSSQAATAFGVWKTASDELAAATEEHNKQIEKQAMLMEYVNTAVNGVTDALTSLITDGSKGMEEFGKSILKLATNLLKMAIAQFISSAISSLGLFGVPAAIGGAAALGGSAAGLIGKVSLADGGLLTGETMVRAGEYPGVQADPEVISPVSKIQKYIREAVGHGGGNLHAVISGDDILLTTSKAQGRANRRGSGNLITF